MRLRGLNFLWGWLAWRLFGPWRPPRFEGRQEKPLGIPGRTVFAGGRELFLREAGSPDASPLVLLPGWGADSLLNWHRVIPLLGDRYRVVAIDLRSHGKSDPAWEPFRIDQVADEVAQAMETVGIARAVVAGYSMGGMVAQALARRHPSKVSHLVLAATAAYVPLAARRARRRLFVLGRALERLSPVEAARQRWRYLMRRGAVDPRHGRWLWEHLITRSPTLHYDVGLAAMDFDSRSWVGHLHQPALVVIATDDLLIPPVAQHELAVSLPRATAVDLVGAGHEACLTHCDELAKAILAFLEGDPPPG